MHLRSAVSLLEVSCRAFAPDDLIDWHSHWHDELCLVLEGTPTVGHGGSKLVPETDTLFLFKESEEHGVWNSGNSTARLWMLEFRINPAVKADFRELFDCPPERRVLKLSASQRHRFCGLCQKLALEKDASGYLNAFAAFAWLTLQLVDVARWVLANAEVDLTDCEEEIDPQCFELWQQIHRQVFHPSSLGPMLFGLNPRHDSLRHRFRKLFGISPQGMLIRLRMDRAKDLLRTSNLSVKEIAYALGYSRQHDLTRAFHNYIGTSPSEWRARANGIEENGSETTRRSVIERLQR
jgi:AraC-like DNA-binding protein